MDQVKATIKKEYEDVMPEQQYPVWIAYVGEDEEHLRGRIRNKRCDPEKYDWNGSSTKPKQKEEIVNDGDNPSSDSLEA